MEASLGIDLGSISTKGVILDNDNNILASTYLWTEGDPIKAVKKVLKDLEEQLPKDIKVTSIGTTGSARKLIGTMLDATSIKNEITAHAIGTLSKYPNIKTIVKNINTKNTNFISKSFLYISGADFSAPPY